MFQLIESQINWREVNANKEKSLTKIKQYLRLIGVKNCEIESNVYTKDWNLMKNLEKNVSQK